MTLAKINRNVHLAASSPGNFRMLKFDCIHTTVSKELFVRNRRSNLLIAASGLALTLFTAGSTLASDGNVPPNLAQAHDHGKADPAKVINIIVHLTPREPSTFKAAVDARYDPASPRFHKWLTDADLKLLAPSQDAVSTVRNELERQGLSIISVQKDGFSVLARGTIGDVARAFNTEIHDFDRGGSVFRANVVNAQLSGAAGSFVASVSGLESHTVRPALAQAVNLATGRPYASSPVADVAAAGGLKSIISDQSLSAAQTFNFSTPGAALPTATYSGIVYGAPNNLVVDFTSHQLQRAYGLEKAYADGLDGRGQTIVLLEAYGYPTIEADANAFSKLNGLPSLTSATFRIVYPQGKPKNPNAGILKHWNTEIALDVQWTHSIAPGAKIVVVASNGDDSVDFQAAMQSVIDDQIGYVVSDSWEEDTDLYAGPSEQESYENILTIGAAKGISFQFSTGDSGDAGVGEPLGAPGVPSVAPHAVAVGGTTILSNPDGKGFLTTAWGTSDVVLDYKAPLDPPTSPIYVEGAGGGGESVFWPKPQWQSALPGTGRQTPDISALANPLSGVPIVVTDTITKTQVIVTGFGGTSLASPIFTAVWAIADQKAGHPLGQASPTIARMTTGIADVLPISSSDNISGSITDTNGTMQYSARQLFKGAYNHKQEFLAPVAPLPQSSAAVGLAFGLDTSFTVTPGWDNATGYGTIDGLNFINSAASFGSK